jgi:uncharacterized repeat protein (TIGR03847 family)
MGAVYDLNPVSHLTIGTIGPPGKRVFYLQGKSAGEQLTLVIEKQHAVALAASLDDLLAELDARFPRPAGRDLGTATEELGLPVDPLFRVGQIGLGYDQTADLVVLIAYELTPEEDEDASVVRFWGKREQMRRLRNTALEAVEGGRPTCPHCGELIDPEGHLCPRRNGHGNNPKFAL